MLSRCNAIISLIMEKHSSKNIQAPSAKYQYLAASVVNLIMLGYGVCSGWSSPAIILLTSDESPLPSGKITMTESSWIASLTNIGGLFGNIFFGCITSKYGRKKPLLVMAIPTIISWLLILYAQNFYYLYGARILNGFVGGGVFVIVPLFLSEIANDRVRGTLGSMFVLSFNVGVLIVFTMGHFCDYYAVPKFVVMLTVLFAILLPFFPETAVYLVKQNQIAEAENSIRFYHNLSRRNDHHEIVQFEINKLRSAIRGAENEQNSGNALKWSDFKRGPARKAMLIGIVLVALNQFSGCVAMLNYTATIFQEAGSNLSPNISAICVGAIELVGSYVAMNLVDRAGRKFLFAVSTIGTAIGLVSLGVYMLLKSYQYDVETFNWIPVASFSFIIFIASWALLSLPFLIISEIMPEKVKDFGASICMSLLWLFSFVVVKFLPLLTETFGFHVNMFASAGLCVIGTIFIIYYVPETRGKSYEQIMNSLQ